MSLSWKHIHLLITRVCPWSYYWYKMQNWNKGVLSKIEIKWCERGSPIAILHLHACLEKQHALVLLYPPFHYSSSLSCYFGPTTNVVFCISYYDGYLVSCPCRTPIWCTLLYYLRPGQTRPDWPSWSPPCKSQTRPGFICNIWRSISNLYVSNSILHWTLLIYFYEIFN